MRKEVNMAVSWKRVEKVKKVNDSIVDLDKVKGVGNFENNVQGPVEDLDAFNYWKNIKEGLGVKEYVETPYYLKGVEVEDLDEPPEVKFQKLLQPKPVAQFQSSEKISKLFEVVSFTNSLYVLIVTMVPISLKVLRKEIIQLLYPVEDMIEKICGVSLEQLKKMIRFGVKEQILTISEVLSCLTCRELNKVQIDRIFKSSSTTKVKVIEVEIRGDFGEFESLSEQVIRVLMPLEKFSLSNELKFEKCKFCK